MTSTVPFDPTELEIESESATRARHESVEWGQVRPLPIRTDDFELDPQFEPYTPSGGRLDRFTNEYDDLPIHITRLQSGVLFGQEFLICDADHPTVSNERLYLTRHKRALRRLDLDQMHAEQDVIYLVGANAEPNNFYHWNFQCLPGIVLLRAYARTQGQDYRIVVPPMNESRRRSLELADIDASECVELKPDSFIMNVPILYTSATCGYYALQPSSQLIELLNPYLANCLSNSSSSLPTRFYLSRRDAPGKREIKNEKDLVGALKHRGYDELVMSELSIEDQVAAFARAESIVAPHGAGLVNLMFAPETARLLEILPENYRMAYFFRLSQVRGMRYSQVLSRVAGSWEGTDVHQCPVVVDVDKVLSTLDRSESASAISGVR